MMLNFPFKIKKEEPSSEGGKGNAMETSSGEDRKPEVKTEPKEEEEGSTQSTTTSSPAGAQSKKKSTEEFPFINHAVLWFSLNSE